MNEQQHATETELPSTHASTMISDEDEFVENANVSKELNNDEDGASLTSHPPHDKWIWLHAAFHCLVTMVVSRYIIL